jgi:hypothetical protein
MMDKRKIHEPTMSFKLFACGANCELEGCNSTIAKVTMAFKLWATLLRSSMSKDFERRSASSCLQNGEGERLKQILLGFIIGHLIVANNARALLLIQSGCLFQGGNCHVGNHLGFIFVAFWLSFVVNVTEG